MTDFNPFDRIVSYNNIALERIRNHPFVVEAHRAALELETVHRWIFCAGRESRSFPTILENMLKLDLQPAVRTVLEKNLNDEYGNGNPEQAHYRHYIHLLSKIGLSETEFDAYSERAGIKLALDMADWVSNQQDVGIAIGYMLVNEGMTPITYGAVDAAIQPHHPNLRTQFFSLHVQVDAEHLEQLYDAVQFLLPDGEESVKQGIELGERGMAALLDEAHGVFRQPLAA